MLNRLEVDRAVFFAIAIRVWQFLAGPVTLLLIAGYFRPEVQGYYYTFGSLLALQSFLELGLSIVILNLASHEWSHLRQDADGRLTGNPEAHSRLASLLRFASRWYSVVGLLYILLVGTAGWMFLARDATAGIAWRWPWVCATIATGLPLCWFPRLTILEGCNQVVAVNRFRFGQALLGNGFVWLAIVSGAGLWAMVASAVTRAACEFLFLFLRNRRFFRRLQAAPPGSAVDWRNDIWPLQSRLAVQSVFSYFAFSLFTPVMFAYHGAVVAGQMGMTWTVLNAIQAIALAWVQTRAPRFGMLVAQQQFAELHRVFWRVTWISWGVILTVGTAFCLFVWGLHLADGWMILQGTPLARLPALLSQRMLPLGPTVLFTIGIVLYHLAWCETMYVRAHREEPFLRLSVLFCILTGGLVWGLGSRFGPIGSAGGYLLVIAVLFVPGVHLIWRRYHHARQSVQQKSVQRS